MKQISGKRPTIKQNDCKVVIPTQSKAKAMIEKPPHNPLKIDYGNGWTWYSEEDKYVKDDFVVTGQYVAEWLGDNRKIERVHIQSILDRTYESYKKIHNL